MASITSPALSNAIRTDVPAINAILKALAKSDPSALTDIENGTKRIVEVSGKWNFQELVDGSWVTRKSFNIDASSLDGKTVSVDATASTIPLRDTSGKLVGDITGNAATATKANALASTLAIGGGGTGSTSAADARTSLGVPPTSHASTTTTYGISSDTQYGHPMASSTTPKALGTAAVGSETAKFARGDHVHPVTAATDSVVGSVKLSDSTSSTSAASAGIAASPKAVKAAYDLANTANTTATAAQTAATAAQNTANSKLSSITAGTGIAVSGSTVSLATLGSAGNGGPTANATLSYGGTFIVPYFTYDAYGRITGRTNRTMTMPALNNWTGTVSQKANVASFTIAAGTTVTKTVSSLTANKPVYIVVTGTNSSVAGYFWISSGTAMNATDAFYPTYINNTSSTWVCVIPTSTSIVLSFSPPSSVNKATSAKFKAYQ